MKSGGFRQSLLRHAGIALLLGLGPLLSGCAGTLLGRKIVAAPNRTAPTFAEKMPQFAEVQAALLPERWRVATADAGVELAVAVVEPANYGFEYTLRLEAKPDGSGHLGFGYDVKHLPGKAESRAVKGTVVLLHGAYTQKESLLHWALWLGERGYRSILVDLRGHGESGGERISYGAREVADLRLVLDDLIARRRVQRTAAVVGVSYGAGIALQWAAADERVATVVALEPYADVRRAVVTVARAQFGALAAGLSDETFAKGLHRAQRLGRFRWSAVDVADAVARSTRPVLLIHGERDVWVTPDHSVQLKEVAPPGSRLLLRAEDDHVTLPLRLSEVGPDIVAWLDQHLHASDAEVSPVTLAGSAP